MSLRDLADQIDRLASSAERATAALAATSPRPTPAGFIAATQAALQEATKEADFERLLEWGHAFVGVQAMLSGWAEALTAPAPVDTPASAPEGPAEVTP